MTSMLRKKLKKGKKVLAEIGYFDYDEEDEPNIDWETYFMAQGWSDDLDKII